MASRKKLKTLLAAALRRRSSGTVPSGRIAAGERKIQADGLRQEHEKSTAGAERSGSHQELATCRGAGFLGDLRGRANAKVGASSGLADLLGLGNYDGTAGRRVVPRQPQRAFPVV